MPFQTLNYRREGLCQLQNKKDLKPWKPSNPAKGSNGLGNYDGCIGSKFEHLTNENLPESRKRKVSDPKNITTNPGKKGTYGMVGTSIGQLKGIKGKT